MEHVTRTDPFSFSVDPSTGIVTPHDNLIQRRLSHMNGMFMDQAAREAMLEVEDTLLYEVYEVEVPDEAGHLMVCTSITYPGKVGREYFMTKGHFHEKIQTAEIYSCLRGQGIMMMESDRGDWKAEPMTQGRAVYVPPYYAHRSINTGQEPLISLCVYPGGAGHDYATIETKGFRKLVLEKNGKPEIEDNPKWKSRI
ncbi:MAG: cupin domain-containing protein [Proteobacteria bacterium]|nr:cupin domain-containing protein [Pseudomonadota bacterium]NIS72562.1 cupin domain-containing protein [Pseudomonadota bacterium]